MQSKQVIKNEVKYKCRDRHVSNKDHNVDPMWCPKCKANVEVKQGNFCECCGKHIDKEETWIETRKILNKFLSKYEGLIEMLSTDPQFQAMWIKYPTYLKVKHGMFEYIIHPKDVMKFLEISNYDRTLFPLPEVYKDEDEEDRCRFEDNLEKKNKKFNKYNSMMSIIGNRIQTLMD